ncbi:MAG: molybdenum cofactor guanylyltransferase [Planctomycetes bacterium]|nr:molybdenum cofactor guanylyltransferase [Planctomycetota bacterium]
MGRNKALLPLDGRPIIQRLHEQFQALFEEVFVVANDAGLYAAYCPRIVPDIFPGKGPLAGLHSALSHTSREWVFLSACDTPFVRDSVVNGLAAYREGADAVLAETEEGPQPLNAYYSKRCLSAVQRCLEAGELKMVSFLPTVRPRLVPWSEVARWDPRGRTFWNMNTPEDYQTALNAWETVGQRPPPSCLTPPPAGARRSAEK